MCRRSSAAHIHPDVISEQSLSQQVVEATILVEFDQRAVEEFADDELLVALGLAVLAGFHLAGDGLDLLAVLGDERLDEASYRRRRCLLGSRE